MWWFALLFPVVMIVGPALMIWWAERTLPPAPKTRGRRILWGVFIPATALTLILYVVSLANHGPEKFVRNGMVWMCYPLWGLAIGLVVRPDPRFGESNRDQPVRSASLAPRQLESPIPPSYWRTCWIATGLILAFNVAAAVHGGAGGVQWLVIGLGTAGALGCLGLTQAAIRLTLIEPEPRTMLDRPDIDEAYATFRRRRAWAFFALFAVTMPAALTAMAICWPWMQSHAQWIAIGGGIGGTAIGLAGSAFGVWADLQRKRLRDWPKIASAGNGSDYSAAG